MGCCKSKEDVIETEDDLKRKVIIVGDGGVGKTCLIRRYKTDEFDEFTPQSVVTSCLETYDKESTHKGKQYVTVICDTGGQETFKHLRRTIYPNSDVIIICFSLDDTKSLESVHDLWVPELRKLCPGVPMILSGNKRDLREEARKLDGFIRESKGNQTAKKHNMLTYIETSSVTGANVERVFEVALEEAVKRKKQRTKINFDDI